MAKQTFSVGQVLTAAQMTSLQQTAMLGGAASAKTASYTLVAADAGTAISMTSTSATTITVNTGLFAEGDTVQITNLGAGVCTITAGTATVNSSASLALAQYESGFLDFTSTSAAIFVKGAGAAAASGGMTLLSTTTLTGGATTISSISSSYKQLLFRLTNITPDTAAALRITLNGNSSSIYGQIAQEKTSASGATDVANNSTSWRFTTSTGLRNSDTLSDGYLYFTDYTNTVVRKNGYYGWSYIGDGNALCAKTGNITFNDPAAISSITFTLSTGSFTLGTIETYGVS